MSGQTGTSCTDQVQPPHLGHDGTSSHRIPGQPAMLGMHEPQHLRLHHVPTAESVFSALLVAHCRFKFRPSRLSCAASWHPSIGMHPSMLGFIGPHEHAAIQACCQLCY